MSRNKKIYIFLPITFSNNKIFKMKILYRLARSEDIPRLIDFGVSSFSRTFGHLYPSAELQFYLSETYTHEKYHKILTTCTTPLWIAEDSSSSSGEANVVGYILVGSCKLPHPDVQSNDFEIQRLYVHQDYFGKGVANHLMSLAMEYFKKVVSDEKVEHPGGRERGIWLGVYSENFRAQRFYEKHNFHKVGEYDFHVGSCIDREFIMKFSGSVLSFHMRCY